MLDTHEFDDVLHGGCIEALACGKESKAVLLAVGTEVPLFHFIFRRVWLHAFRQSSCVADALFEVAEAMIGEIRRILRVSHVVISPLDIARFLAVQETDDELVNSLIPVCISTISIIAKIGIECLFPCSFEGPVEHFGKLGIAFVLCPFLLIVGLKELRIRESYEEFNIICPIIRYHFRIDLGGVLKNAACKWRFRWRDPTLFFESRRVYDPNRPCLLDVS